MRNLAIGLLLTAAIVGAGFALAFLKGRIFFGVRRQKGAFRPISDQLAESRKQICS